MEKQKIFTNTTFCVVGLSIVVLIVLTIFQHQQIKKSSGDETSETVTKDESVDVATPGPVETLQKNSTQRTEIAGIDKKISTDEIDELEYQLDAAEEELDTPMSSCPMSWPENPKQQKVPENFIRRCLKIRL